MADQETENAEKERGGARPVIGEWTRWASVAVGEAGGVAGANARLSAETAAAIVTGAWCATTQTAQDPGAASSIAW